MRTLLRILLGLFLAFAGISHLTWARTEFLAQVPDWVPMSKDLVVLLSGGVEILMGLSLLFLTKFRVQVGIFIALFFIAVFPGNYHQYAEHIDAFGLNSDTARFIRLLFQPVLVIWVLYATGAWRDRRSLFSKSGRS